MHDGMSVVQACEWLSCGYRTFGTPVESLMLCSFNVTFFESLFLSCLDYSFPVDAWFHA
jgi:hypothetical protein